MEDLRGAGYLVEKVEQRLPIPGKFVTRDLYQCIDLMAIQAGRPVLAVQVTSRSNVNARMEKAKNGGNAFMWVQTGNVFEIWGYGGIKTARRVVRMGMDGEWIEVKEGEHVAAV